MMKPHLFDNLLRGLTHLPQVQLKQVRDRIDFLMDGRDPGDGRASESRMVYDEIVRFLEGRGATAPHWGTFQRTRAGRGFEKRARKLIDWIRRRFGAESPAERLKAVRIGLAALGHLIEEMNLPVSVFTINSNLDRIPEAIDKAFPGYANSRLLKILLKAVKKG